MPGKLYEVTVFAGYGELATVAHIASDYRAPLIAARFEKGWGVVWVVIYGKTRAKAFMDTIFWEHHVGVGKLEKLNNLAEHNPYREL